MRIKYRRLLLLALVALALALAACGGSPAPNGDTATECPDVEVADCPECEACPEPEPVDTGPVDVVPFEEAWATSPHADDTAEAFRHWDEDDPAENPRPLRQVPQRVRLHGLPWN